MKAKQIAPAFLVGAALTWFLWPTADHAQGASTRIAEVSSDTPQRSPSSPPRAIRTHRASSGAVDEGSIPIARLFGPDDAYSPSARAVLKNAVECARLIQDGIDRIPEASSDRNLLYALQKRLFTDDYTMAMGMMALDCDQAEGVFADIQGFLRSGQPPALPRLPPASSSNSPPPRSLRDRFADLYRLWFQVNPEYTPILEQLQQLTPHDPLVNDLFKDAAMFVALHTQIDDWRKADEQWIRSMPDGQSLDPQVLANWDARQEAYREAFRFRFRECHGLDAEAAMAALSGLALRDVGPDLRVPCP